MQYKIVYRIVSTTTTAGMPREVQGAENVLEPKLNLNLLDL